MTSATIYVVYEQHHEDIENLFVTPSRELASAFIQQKRDGIFPYHMEEVPLVTPTDVLKTLQTILGEK
jgi:hypothetical protein